MMHQAASVAARSAPRRDASPRAFGCLFGSRGFDVWASHPIYAPQTRRLWLVGSTLTATGVLLTLAGVFGFYAGAPIWLWISLLLTALPLLVGSGHFTTKAVSRLPEILRTAQLATPVVIASGLVTTLLGLAVWRFTAVTAPAWTGAASAAGPVTALVGPGLTAYLIVTALRRLIDGVHAAAIVAALQIALVRAVVVQVPSHSLVQWDVLEQVGFIVGVALAAASWLQQTRAQPSAGIVSYDSDGWRIRGIYRSRGQGRRTGGAGGDWIRLSRDQLSGTLLTIMDRAMTDYVRMQDTRYERVGRDQLVRIAAEVRGMIQAEEQYGDSTLVSGDDLRRQTEELRQLSMTAAQNREEVRMEWPT